MRPPARIFIVLSALLVAAAAWPAAATGTDAAPAAAKPLPALTPAAPDALSRALAGGRVDEATYALERVTSLVAPAGVRARFGDVVRSDPRDATLLLRDLAARTHLLGGADRARAEAVLARPTEGGSDPDGFGYSTGEETPVCSTDVCVHYVGSSGDAPPSTDTSPANGIPDQVDLTLDVMDEVWAFEVDGYGYRAPKSDASSSEDGGNGKLDVYLSDIGGFGLYGFCTTDDPARGSRYDVSAYCVLDDDYASGQFGYPDPLDPLQVTAAHEFHHAVQFAYDYLEDGWIMEASSTWIEDEVYDAVNDNVQYLGESPLSQPQVPLDRNGPMEWYGAWIFPRFLSEYVGANDGGSAAPDPTIVRSIWSRLDAAPGGPDRYSTQGIDGAIAARTLNGAPGDLRKVFADFAVWNARPADFYDEGASYFPADQAATRTLTGSQPSYASTDPIDHLANRFVTLRPGAGVGATAKLKIRVDGPDAVSDPAVTAVVVTTTGSVKVKRVALDGSGRGSARVAFGSSTARVIVIATNASVRYSKCWAYATKWSCGGGTPVDENRVFEVRASVV
jgi:hypothetical protein